MSQNYILQKKNIFTPEECEEILRKRYECSSKDEVLSDLVVKSNNLEWAKLLSLIRSKVDPIIDSYLDNFFGLMPRQIISISHLGFLHDDFGSFTEMHYDWEMVQTEEEIIVKPFVMLIYLNDNFKGGELLFPLQKFSTTPEKGSIALFPCNFCFPHVSQPITEGEKHLCRITFKMDVEAYKVKELEL